MQCCICTRLWCSWWGCFQRCPGKRSTWWEVGLVLSSVYRGSRGMTEPSWPAMWCLSSRRGPQRYAPLRTWCCSPFPLQHSWWLGGVLWRSSSEVDDKFFGLPHIEEKRMLMRPTTVISSANLMMWLVLWLGTQSWVNRVKSNGLITHPCGAPVLSVMVLDVFPPTHTFCGLSDRKSSTQLLRGELSPTKIQE